MNILNIFYINSLVFIGILVGGSQLHAHFAVRCVDGFIEAGASAESIQLLRDLSKNESWLSRSLVARAQIFAKGAHKNEFRKFDGKPYIGHPVEVSKIVRTYTNDPSMISAALLHDVVENTTKTARQKIELLRMMKIYFGKDVADLVLELTSDKVKQGEFESKAHYLSDKLEKMSLRALLIKLADRLHNVSDFANANIRFLNKYSAETNFILEKLSRRVDLLKDHHDIIGRIYEAMVEGEMAFEGRIFAVIKYEGVKRIHTNEDFIFHPTNVAHSLRRMGAPVEVQIAAYLKNVFKIGKGATYEEVNASFGVRVANLVAEMTDSDVERAKAGSRIAYIVQRARNYSDEALLIRLASRYLNIYDIQKNDLNDKFEPYIDETIAFYESAEKSGRKLSYSHKHYIRLLKSYLGKLNTH